MKFKLFGVVWDLTLVAGALWAFAGAFFALGGLAMKEAPWWGWLLFILGALIYLATAESVSKKLEPTQPQEE